MEVVDRRTDLPDETGCERTLEVSAKLLEGIGIPLKRAMNDSGYGWEDIDEIIMIGGSGKMKIVQNYLQF